MKTNAIIIPCDGHKNDADFALKRALLVEVLDLLDPNETAIVTYITSPPRFFVVFPQPQTFDEFSFTPEQLAFIKDANPDGLLERLSPYWNQLQKYLNQTDAELGA